MAGIDIYKACPGGCGKKIKFCCSKDIAQELERLQRMIAGEQYQAARDKLAQLLQQYPGRNCLLAIQIELALLAQDFDAITAAVRAFHDNAPDNPLAISYRMMTELSKGACHAMSVLERAFHAEHSDLPDEFALNLVKTASIFVEQHSFMPALALLRLSYRYNEKEMPLRDQLLNSLERSVSIPFMERYEWTLDRLPEKVTWRVEMEMVIAAVERGAWGWAADYLQQMSLRILDQPILLRTQALCLTWLDRRVEASQVFRRYSELRNVTEQEALWAEMMAQALTPPNVGEAYDNVVRVYDIRDVDGLLEHLRLSPLFFVQPHATWLQVRPAEQVKPRCVYSFLDRPLDPEVTDPKWDELPLIQSTMAVYGRETDRPARLEVHVVRNKDFDAVMARVMEQLGQFVAEEFREDVEGQGWAFEYDLRVLPIMAATIPRTKRRELMREVRDHMIQDRWKDVALPGLGNRRPVDVAQTGRAGIRAVAAAIKLMEIQSISSLHTDFNALRASLGVPEETPWDPTGAESTISPIDFNRLKFEAMTNESLLGVFLLSRHFRLLPALRHTAMEFLRRDALGPLPEPLEWGDIYASMANTTQDLDESMQWVNKARQRAVAEGKSPAQWLALELSLRYERGELQEAERVLRELERRHMREPGVEMMVRQVLQGIRDSMERTMPMADLPDVPTGPAEKESGIWTPDSRESVDDSSVAAGPSNPSKLWLPDSP